MTDEPTDRPGGVEPDVVPPADRPAATADGEARTPGVDDGGPARADLDRVERDLAGVEAALGRLDDGTYWTDEVTGEPIPEAVLADDPVTRRAR